MKKLFLSLSMMAFAGAAFAQANITDPPPPPAPPPSANPAHPPMPQQPPHPKLISLPIGSEIPNRGLIMPNAMGEPMSLEMARKDKGLIVVFSSNICKLALKSQRHLQELMQTAKTLNLGMVVVNSNEGQRPHGEDMGKMTETGTHQHFIFPYLMDNMSLLADQFGALHTPEVFLFNSKGLLVYKGALDDNPADPDKSKHFYIMDAVKNMLAGKPIKPNETKSVGCDIARMPM